MAKNSIKKCKKIICVFDYLVILHINKILRDEYKVSDCGCWVLKSSKCEMEGIKCITELPEECMSHILSLTSPRDAARSAVLSSEFRSAANSDIVWGSFLPSGFEEIISKLESPLVFSSKKDLYLHFCNGPFLLKDNTKVGSFTQFSSYRFMIWRITHLFILFILSIFLAIFEI